MRAAAVIITLLSIAARAGAAEKAAAPGQGPAGPMVMAPVQDHVADFQPYIFWAYGIACLLLFLFTLWTLLQLRRVEEKVDYLARGGGVGPGSGRVGLEEGSRKIGA